VKQRLSAFCFLSLLARSSVPRPIVMPLGLSTPEKALTKVDVR
jgi:hypothetical protein